jgi:hypothetical protein
VAAGVYDTIDRGSLAMVTAVPSSSVRVVGKAATGGALGAPVGVGDGMALGPADAGAIDPLADPPVQPATTRRSARKRLATGPVGGADDEERREWNTGTSEGVRRGGENRKPLDSNGSNEGPQPVGRTVLPTFLSKVRACTVGSATGLALPKGRSP